MRTGMTRAISHRTEPFYVFVADNREKKCSSDNRKPVSSCTLPIQKCFIRPSATCLWKKTAILLDLTHFSRSSVCDEVHFSPGRNLQLSHRVELYGHLHAAGGHWCQLPYAFHWLSSDRTATRQGRHARSKRILTDDWRLPMACLVYPADMRGSAVRRMSA
jgi:hypothetical protein